MMMIDYNDDQRFGFVLLKNVPVEEGPVPALQVRLGVGRKMRGNLTPALCRCGRGSRR